MLKLSWWAREIYRARDVCNFFCNKIDLRKRLIYIFTTIAVLMENFSPEKSYNLGVRII